MGGHGGLNILPQKSWKCAQPVLRQRVPRLTPTLRSVYNFEARARVERDEAAAAAAEDSAQAQRLASERRFRHDLLLARAGGGAAPAFDDSADEPRSAARHAPAATEPPDERFRLGAGAGRRDPPPWYAKSASSLRDPPRGAERSLPARVRREREERLRSERPEAADAPRLLSAPLRSAAKPSVDELRAQRLAREQRERERAARLLASRLPEELPRESNEAPRQRYHGGYGNAPKRPRHDDGY